MQRVFRRDRLAVLAAVAAPQQRLVAVAFADQVGAALAASRPVTQ
jgi:hypothetical protein